MVIKSIDGEMLKKMFLAGAKNIEANKERINELNVFPVPDGDTGTNMTMTIMSAAREVQALPSPTIAGLAKAISSGSLRGARGNSGVILSQLFRGFTKEIAHSEEITASVMAAAFHRAVETAYKAVMKPKEGTILTVAKGGAAKAMELAEETEDLAVFAEEVLKYMREVLDQTPEMLPVLKEAGVVDSGGEGLLAILEGAVGVMLGKDLELLDVAFAKEETQRSSGSVDSAGLSASEIRFGYCTEFIVILEQDFPQKKEWEFKSYLESIGDSIVVVSDDGMIKVHVHTNDPGMAIQKGLSYGSLSSIKVDNMREEHQEKVILAAERAKVQAQEASPKADSETGKAKTPAKDVGFISVSVGEGINEIFEGLGVDCLIEGGQTMNPSTEDLLQAIDKVSANTIFILPNNKNIILAAEQAKALTKDKEIIVIPSKTIPQGITAMINYVKGQSAKENEACMLEEMKRVKTGQVTYAVRDTSLEGKTIKTGDIMGIGDKKIETVGSSVSDTTLALVDELMDSESELVTLYYGQEVAEEEAEALRSSVEEKYPQVEVEAHFGGQPIYYYVLSVE